MNALDQMLQGDEPLILMIAEEQGILAADDFKHTFNNGCLQIAGFERALNDFLPTSTSILAPLVNMSSMEH